MPLHMTKIAFGCESARDLREWLESHSEAAHITTRYLPKRQAEMAGGSLYWILAHTLIGRSPILRFEEREGGGKHWIHLAPTLIAVAPRPRRAHQGWRYLTQEDAPADLDALDGGEALPGGLAQELGKLGLL